MKSENSFLVTNPLIGNELRSQRGLWERDRIIGLWERDQNIGLWERDRVIVRFRS
jgi:hypothetical protein